MNKRISDWSIVNNHMHRVLIVFSVPMLLLILWQLYTSDKVVDAMRGNDLSFGVFFYFIMIAIEIGVLAFILRVGRSEVGRRISGAAVLALPFVWIIFNSMYAYYEIGAFGLELAGVPAYFLSVVYSLLLIGLIYKTFALPYNINSGVAIKAIESESRTKKENRPSPKQDKKKTPSKIADKKKKTKAAK